MLTRAAKRGILVEFSRRAYGFNPKSPGSAFSQNPEYEEPRDVQPCKQHRQEQRARHYQQQASHHITTATQHRASHAESPGPHAEG